MSNNTQKVKTDINTIEVGKTYLFDDLIHDTIITRFGEMNILKLVKGDKIMEVVKAPRDLMKFLTKNPEVKAFTLKKIVADGEYKNYIFN